MDTLHVATYNIHKGFSNFNRRMVVHELRDRLRQLGADLVFLQEVLGDHQRHAERIPDWPEEPQYEFLADSVWQDYAYGRNSVYDQGHHGNAVLSRYPIVRWDNEDVSAHALESRGLLHCEIKPPGYQRTLHCICVHLALHENGRRAQIGALIERLQREVPRDDPVIVAGDFNDWRNLAGRRLTTELGLREAFRDPKFARGPFAPLYELLAPAAVDINTGQRLVRIDRHLSEYFLFQTLWALFKTRFTHRQRRPYAAFETQAILDVWKALPANVVRRERNKRAHLSSVLSRNEVERDYAYNRALFRRVAQGWYQFNPELSVRRKVDGNESWVPIYQALNLPFVGEFAWDFVWPRLAEYLMLAGLPERAVPIALERLVARQQQAQREQEREAEALKEAVERNEAERLAARQRMEAPPPKWGTPAAKRAEIERIRQAIAKRQES